MKQFLMKHSSPAWKARLVRFGFNWQPAYRASGGRVDYVSPDLSLIRVRLPLNRRTRNAVGSIFGGALFAATDGPHPVLMMMVGGLLLSCGQDPWLVQTCFIPFALPCVLIVCSLARISSMSSCVLG